VEYIQKFRIILLLLLNNTDMHHMSKNYPTLCCSVIGAIAVIVSAEAAESANWPQWRGPTANGYAVTGNPPVEWSENKHIKWKKDIPGEGHSTPVIWEERLFLLSAVPVNPPQASLEQADRPPASQEQRRRRGGSGGAVPTQEYAFTTFCIHKNTGETLWTREGGKEIPHEGHHPTNTYSSASAVTDGEHVISFFGSRGLYCYDMDGNEIWHKDLGNMPSRNGFGEGASPTFYGNTLIVLWDNESDSFVYAFDKRTGKELWKQRRDEKTGWTTPYVLTHQGVTQVIINATNKVRSYHLETGELIWECGGQTTNAIPSVVADGEYVYAVSGYRGNMAMAIALGGKGDLTGSEYIKWEINRGTPYVPSPLLYDGKIWFTQGNNAVITCVHPKTGEPFYSQQRLQGPSGFYASPVGAANRVYLAGRNGTTVVIDSSDTLNVLSINELSDDIDASPVVSGDALYIRSHHHLYCIAE
jgi:outer membrane protein assembly factor BamB